MGGADDFRGNKTEKTMPTHYQYHYIHRHDVNEGFKENELDILAWGHGEYKRSHDDGDNGGDETISYKVNFFFFCINHGYQ